MPSAQKQPDIRFTIDQIQWLEKMFPESTAIADHDTMVSERAYRHVLNIIKQQSKVTTRHVSTANDLS